MLEYIHSNSLTTSQVYRRSAHGRMSRDPALSPPLDRHRVFIDTIKKKV